MVAVASSHGPGRQCGLTTGACRFTGRLTAGAGTRMWSPSRPGPGTWNAMGRVAGGRHNPTMYSGLPLASVDSDHGACHATRVSPRHARAPRTFPSDHAVRLSPPVMPVGGPPIRVTNAPQGECEAKWRVCHVTFITIAWARPPATRASALVHGHSCAPALSPDIAQHFALRPPDADQDSGPGR
jgi:hypothetical protein